MEELSNICHGFSPRQNTIGRRRSFKTGTMPLLVMVVPDTEFVGYPANNFTGYSAGRISGLLANIEEEEKFKYRNF